jgi:hypothetical protein
VFKDMREEVNLHFRPLTPEEGTLIKHIWNDVNVKDRFNEFARKAQIDFTAR